MNGKRNFQKIKVGLVQINNKLSEQNFLPYSVGLLQSYAQSHAIEPEHFEFLLPIFSRINVEEAAKLLMNSQIVAFSTYVWNIKISLEIAKKAKQLNPEVVIVFGGPQVPNKSEDFLRKYPFIDLCSHGEGEQTFLSILENFEARNWAQVPSISFLKNDGTFVSNPKISRINDISIIPSPYLEGVFDPLIEAYPSERWIALWETNRGCPFSCTYCDWGSATQSKVYTFEIDRLFQEIEWFAEHKISLLYCCDANFGILPRDIEIAKFVATTKRKYGYPRSFNVQNTKNATERAYQVQKIIAEAELNENRGLTIAMQSLTPQVLNSIKRHNISLDSFQELQRRFTRDGLQTYTDIIIGLPGETYNSFTNGISNLIENGQHNRISFNNLSILPNAEMGEFEYQKTYGLETVESEVKNLHGPLNESVDEIVETQQLIVSTNTMQRDDWCRARAFAWLTSLLHFDRVLQLAFILLHKVCSVSYRELIEIFLEEDSILFPTIAEVGKFFIDKARDIQSGGAEHCPSEQWLNIWWSADEYILIKLVVENKIEKFYKEAEVLLSNFLNSQFIQIPIILHESILLNKTLLKQPFQNKSVDLRLSYNLWEFYQAAINGVQIPLEEKTSYYYIDCSETWSSYDEWCREVIWNVNIGHIDQNKALLRQPLKI